MVTLTGKSAFGGIAIGKIVFCKKSKRTLDPSCIEDIDFELQRVKEATEIAVTQLQALYEKALADVGEENAAIFEIHQMMLTDDDYQQAIADLIQKEKVSAAYAVSVTGRQFAQRFEAMDDEYMKARAADVEDISERLINAFFSNGIDLVKLAAPAIIAAEDLSPSETIQLDTSKVLAFITQKGSSNSHTAILARTMNIPAVVDVGEFLLSAYNDELAIVDGFSGTIFIQPDADTLQQMTAKKCEADENRHALQKLTGLENRTLDGRTIQLYANVGNLSDMNAVLENDAGGIGLFRSEFLYLENQTFPSEEQQFSVYKRVAQIMQGKKVIIRTLDIGADKQADYFQLPMEDNPALGYRAIRICLTQPDIFKVQLRALYRASAFGNISIMFPMIISLEEVLEIKKIVAEVKAELDAAGIHYGDKVELGIMIETPAAAIISDLLAKEVDFFSLGTNDLTQYTLAIDRQNSKLDKFFNAHHIALLRLIKLVADNAHANGIPVGICGELGADASLLETFLTLGIDELSVSPGCILGL
ncbi:MAG TPA: phosphoenolpyruvate--protein phosphotransferase, partial [Negativicutes bacterium]|nr:phosphoenolpyruvate--protein phosphotransferase [Negativicutes bacterium]